MSHPLTPLPRGTNQYADVLDLPFKPGSDAFSAASLGLLMNTGSAADPSAATYRHLVSAGYLNPDGGTNTPGALNPIVNPADLATGYYWWQAIEAADICRLTPFLAKFTDANHTAYDSAAAAGDIDAKLTIWTTHEIRSTAAPGPRNGLPAEFRARLIGQVSISNAANRVTSTTRMLPTGAQWCDTGSVDIDGSISPGLRLIADETGGILDILFDQGGGSGLLVRASSITATCGVGWLRGHL